MKIQTYQLYHGAALTQITIHDSFKALNKASTAYGHYLVNQDIRLFIKHRAKEASPWDFLLTVDELRDIENELKLSENVFLCLVCGQETICTLNAKEFSSLIDLSAKKSQSIVVEVPPGGSMHVRGSSGKLNKTLRHNSFPDKLFKKIEELA